MVFELLAAIGIYVLGAFGVHWAHRRKRSLPAGPSRHYVLHAWNDGGRLEWIVRALLWHGSLRGGGVRITVIDEGSTDETPELLRLLARSCGIQSEPAMQISRARAPEPGKAIRVRLHQPEDWCKLPAVCGWVR